MQIMGEYARDQVRRKVSQVILSEAGRVGYRNAFSMAALVTASSLAALILSATSEAAKKICGPYKCEPDELCCKYYRDGNWLYWCEKYECTGLP
ncbi:hypothetical protein J7M22_07885 [Candidatus Poribacteria bacterium]|nr:hypothetical protein [Candidatus Poribacteria bacterium]